MLKNVKDFDWDEVREALYAFVAWLEENEPHAINTINTFQTAADECPMPDDFE